jgi:hypothetical protein
VEGGRGRELARVRSVHALFVQHSITPAAGGAPLQEVTTDREDDYDMSGGTAPLQGNEFNVSR